MKPCLGMLLLVLAVPCTAVSPYEAVYSVYFGPFHLGEGRYQLQQRVDESYVFSFSSELSLMLLTDTREISSEFLLQDQQIISNKFRQQRAGIGKDFLEVIQWQAGEQISSKFNQASYTTPWQPKVFDPLNAQLQMRLDLINHKESFSYLLLMNNKLDNYTWLNRGEENLVINGIAYRALKFEMQRDSSKRQTFTWFAVNMNYLPLRVLYKIKGTGNIDMKLISYQPLTVNSPLNISREKKLLIK